MKKIITLIALVTTTLAISQNSNSIWKRNLTPTQEKINPNKNLPQKNVFDLDINTLKNILSTSSKRKSYTTYSSTIISLPNSDGNLENFRVYEDSNMDPVLSSKYSDIKSYYAIGIDDSSEKVYFSVSPLGLQAMTLHSGKEATFIEPLTEDLNTYTVYKKSEHLDENIGTFECNVINQITDGSTNTSIYRKNGADDSKLRTFRFALSCTAEYAAAFGGTKALALAGMNNTLTRINGIFETDFGLRLILIANNDNIIYTNSTSDPYSDYTSKYNWGNELQSNLNNTIGLGNYDIGHLFGMSGINAKSGDAGCIGCICSNFNKGSGYTCASPNSYSGDDFDIDYVAHEIGHQLGANHTFTHSTETNSIAQLEPGSGSTIMGYAGVTTKDVQRHSDAYFHAISIQQVTNNIKNKTCAITVNTGNNVPTVDAGPDYTIPKGTPFMLTGNANDLDGDKLSYCWEQMDLGNSTATIPSATATTGPLFRSYPPTTIPTRYFPNLSTILEGQTVTNGLQLPVEALSNVDRNLNFRLTVRDNKLNGSANNTDDVMLTVNGTAGPFIITSQNSTITYNSGSTQSVSWNVAGTTSNGINCTNVDILLSTDGGQTFPITLLANTPNDGFENITIPYIPGDKNRIMVKGNNHIFFDITNANFTITTNFTSVIDTTSPSPSILTVSNITTSSVELSWTIATDNIGISDYDIYQNGKYIKSTSSTNCTISELNSGSVYNYYVIAKDTAGNASPSSNTVSITTLYIDTIAPTSPVLSTSNTTSNTTDLSWTTASDNIGVTGYELYQNGVLLVNITAKSNTISGLKDSTSYSFYVVAKDEAGNTSLPSNTITITTLSLNENTPTIDLSPNVTPEPTAIINYCTSKGNSTSKDYISTFMIGNITNNSKDDMGYGDYTSFSTDLSIGSSYNVTITPYHASPKYTAGYNIWIDFNQDGDFDDTDESVFIKSKTKANNINGTIIIPSTALAGKTRMRVAMKYNGNSSACESFSYGEVEDYTVNIIASGKSESIASSITKPELILYPNPVSGNFINISNLEISSEYRIYNMMGQMIMNGITENNQIVLSTINSGSYILEIKGNKETIIKRFIKN